MSEMSQILNKTHIIATPETRDPSVVELAQNYRSVSTVYTGKGKVSVRALAQNHTWITATGSTPNKLLAAAT